MLEFYLGSDCYSPDTDGDGVTDYVEFYVTHTDLFIPCGDLDTDNDGLTDAEECLYGTHAADPDIDGDGLPDGSEIKIFGTNPLAKDTDNDGLVDGIEIELDLDSLQTMTDGITPDIENEVARSYAATQIIGNTSSPATDFDHLGNASTAAVILPEIIDPGAPTTEFDGILYSEYNAIDGTQTNASQISYELDYNWFFSSNTVYNPGLATVSSIMSAIAYDSNYIYISGHDSFITTIDNALENWMEFHGMKDVVRYDINSLFNDWHVSEMVVGHKEVTNAGITKNVIAIVIRGTNGTLDEWCSNFDIGKTTLSHNEWTVTANHKGFDITANRLEAKLANMLVSIALFLVETYFG